MAAIPCQSRNFYSIFDDNSQAAVTIANSDNPLHNKRLRSMARNLEVAQLMTRGKLITVTAILFVSFGSHGALAEWGQTATPPAATPTQTPPTVTFKASVDLVRIAAVVRDRKGRFVQDLTARDFEVLDGGAAANDHGLPARPHRRQRRDAVRRQRQHGRASDGRARGGAPRPQLAGRRATKRRSSRSTRISTSARRSRPA